MPMSDFYQVFPELAEAELRRVEPAPGEYEGVPADTYTLAEHYCDEAGCDCRRVCIVVAAADREAAAATILLRLDCDGKQPAPYLDPAQPQPPQAPGLLELFALELRRDPGYLPRMQRHYAMFRAHCDGHPYAGAPFAAPAPTLTALPGSAGGAPRHKVGRNDPCPCGSGKKYKQCCMTQLQSAAGGGTRAAAAHAQPPSAAADPGSMDAAQLQAFDEAMTEAARELIEQVRAWKANPQNRGRWGDEVDAALEITRNLSLHLLRLLLTHYAPGGQRRTPLPGYDECLALLTDALTRLRSGADQQWAWALALYERVQIEMAEVGFVPEMDAKVQEHLMRAIHEARLPLSELLRHQVLAVRSHYTRFGAATGAHDLNRMLERMIKKIDTRYVFPELETMLTQLAPLPGESLVEIVTGLMANPRPFWKELAMLLLLHPNPRLRCTLAERFRHGSGIAQLSPLGLRRLIGLRNWLPAEERPAVDELIKIVRKAGVVSAPLPPPGQSLTVYASIFDAVGKHALWAYVKDPKHYRRNAAVLVGQGQGVADVSEPRGFTRDMMDDQARDRIADSALVVDPHYLHRALAHFIAVGLEHDHPPPARLLEFHEMVVGGEYWKPLAVDPAAEIEALTATDPAAFAPARVAEVLAGTGQWPEQHAFADNWFEGSSVIEELLLTHVGAPAHWMEQLPLAAATILTWVMEPKRAIWTGRLLWNGLRLRAALTPQPVPWQDSVIVARALHEGIPLEQIPLMVAVARRSVEPARNRALRGQY